LGKEMKAVMFMGTVISSAITLSHVASGNTVSQTWRGKLIYQESPPVMSVRAYQGSEFSLIINEHSRPLVLRPSEKISHKQLQSFHNQQVEIKAVYVKGTRPSSKDGACPVDFDGQCMRQGEGYQVLSIVRVKRD
jgi:hypothetical protein